MTFDRYVAHDYNDNVCVFMHFSYAAIMCILHKSGKFAGLTGQRRKARDFLPYFFYTDKTNPPKLTDTKQTNRKNIHIIL